jgi:hypothetical protein
METIIIITAVVAGIFAYAKIIFAFKCWLLTKL